MEGAEAAAGRVKILIAFWTVCSSPQAVGRMTTSQAIAIRAAEEGFGVVSADVAMVDPFLEEAVASGRGPGG